MPKYLTIPPSNVPADARSEAFGEAERQTQALGLARRPIVVWYDRADLIGRLAEVWEPTQHEDHRELWGFYEPPGPPSSRQRERIYLNVRPQNLAQLIRTVAHECRHVWQASTYDAHVWMGGRWIDTHDKLGAELDAHSYERTANVSDWMERHQVTPIYSS